MKKGAITYPNSLGGDIHGQIEVPPLVMVSGSTTMNFFQLHYRYGEADALHRIMGWAHLELLMSALFMDGTFRCVHHPIDQCVVVMCHGCYVPVFFIIFSRWNRTVHSKIFHFVIVPTGLHFDDESFTCDCEGALIAAIRDHMPNSVINGFFFPFEASKLKP
ncbi:hypothetical protein PHMEG_0007918 [Phytophthora megakarya]|uniref:Uncharacterized protein n=1 Tax=Phytophthora megakarya TaxID=4795 RepID=A0A225WK98_9STRA|nr:hypothetical protein PHMEG_0007918 [Phytophthora megakarya]